MFYYMYDFILFLRKTTEIMINKNNLIQKFNLKYNLYPNFFYDVHSDNYNFFHFQIW